MRRVLIIDESTTLRFLLTRDLEMNNYGVIQAATVDDGMAALRASRSEGPPLDSVVLSWPATHSSSHRALIALLESPTYEHLSIVILSQNASDEILLWIKQRQNAALTLLVQCSDVPATLDQLCKGSNELSDLYEETEVDPIRVLFVDDSRSIRKYYGRLLSRHHYAVTTAESVKDAWEILGNINFDIVITDYFMPQENGYVLCQKIRKESRLNHIMTAVLTGTYLDKAIRDSLNAGAMECMFKEEADELFLARVFSMARMVRNQREINAEGLRLAGILASVGEGVYGVDSSGEISFINPAALRILGYAKDTNLIGAPAHDCIHPINEHGDNIPAEDSLIQKTYFSSEGLRSHETQFRHQTGRAIPVDCTIVPLMIEGEHEGSVIAFRDVSERKLMEQKLRWQATHDPLTELFNRRYFEEQLELEFHHVSLGGQTSALLFLDLDRFKQINDTAGHEAGDKLLIMISKQLASRARGSDTLARLGGDEFAVILRDIDPSTVKDTADAFRNILSSMAFSHEGHSFNVEGSIGISIINNQSASVNEIMSQADAACHQAKQHGRNLSHIFNPETDTQDATDAETGWKEILQTALDKDHFVLYFQPMLAMSDIELGDLPPEDGELWEAHRLHREKNICVEVLLRLSRDNGELILPNAFLSRAERFELMPKLDLWVIRKSIETLDEINQREQNYTLAINISTQTLSDDAALEAIYDMIDDMDSSPSGISFEVAESIAISNMHSFRIFLEKIKAKGCHFLLDRFGTGFGSFPQLRHLPIDFIKIDGQYIQNMARDAIDRAVVTAINDVAHSIGRHTIAEHVESPETLRLLKICGIDYLQGNYIASPMCMDDLVEILEDEPTIIASSLNS